MPQQADAWYETQWLQNTLMTYQSEGFLTKGLGLPPVEVKASAVKWRLAGSGTAVDMQRGAQEVVPMNAARSIIDGTMTAKQAAEYIDAIDVNRMSANERDIVNRTCAMALGRAVDSMFVTQLGLAATASAQTVGAFANALDLGVVLQGIAQLQKSTKRWQGYRAFCALTSNPWNQLLTFPEFANADWVGGDLPFTKMTDRRSWNGVYFMLFPDDLLPLATNDRTCFMWVQEAIGEADAQTLTGSVTWENTRTAWLHNMWLDTCRKYLQPEGVVSIKCKDNATIQAMSKQMVDALGP
jgi:hypothetical protein